MIPMDECDALEEARRRWGKNAHVRHSQGKLAQGQKPYAVGKWFGHRFHAYGQGESWEQAFEEASKKNPAPEARNAGDPKS
jgi:hypothetical protein